jgi:hypothetical protein
MTRIMSHTSKEYRQNDFDRLKEKCPELYEVSDDNYL